MAIDQRRRQGIQEMSNRAPVKEQSLAVLRERGVPVGTVLDVGVHHCTPELMKAYPGVKHVLFEPVEEFRERIGHLYRSIDYELHSVAVGNETSETALRVMSKLGAGISHSTMVTVPSDESRDDSVRTVPKIALDDFLAGRSYTEPFLLKIDIDGHEMQAIQGAQQTLKKCSIVILECYGSTLPERIDAIQRAGFQLFDLAEPCYYDSAFWQCDAIFVRKDIHKNIFKTIGATVEKGLYTCFGR